MNTQGIAITRRMSLVAGALLLSAAAFAHHSFAMFDRDKTVTITGKVRTFEWTNPHIWLWLNVTDDKGAVTVWGFEGVAPGEATRLNGWSKNTFVKGEVLTVEASPLKDGRPGGSLRKITRADGTVVTRQGTGPASPPAYDAPAAGTSKPQ